MKIKALNFAGVLKHKFNSEEFIKKMKSPLLIMHGDQDRTIPIKHGKRLLQSAVSEAKFDKIVGAGHNDLLNFATQTKAILFFKKMMPH